MGETTREADRSHIERAGTDTDSKLTLYLCFELAQHISIGRKILYFLYKNVYPTSRAFKGVARNLVAETITSQSLSTPHNRLDNELVMFFK